MQLSAPLKLASRSMEGTTEPPPQTLPWTAGLFSSVFWLIREPFLFSLKPSPEASFHTAGSFTKTSSQQRLVSPYIGISLLAATQETKLKTFFLQFLLYQLMPLIPTSWPTFALPTVQLWISLLLHFSFCFSLCCSNSPSFWTSAFWQLSVSIFIGLR